MKDLIIFHVRLMVSPGSDKSWATRYIVLVKMTSTLRVEIISETRIMNGILGGIVYLVLQEIFLNEFLLKKKNISKQYLLKKRTSTFLRTYAMLDLNIYLNHYLNISPNFYLFISYSHAKTLVLIKCYIIGTKQSFIIIYSQFLYFNIQCTNLRSSYWIKWKKTNIA